jgi:hypothetical protein
LETIVTREWRVDHAGILVMDQGVDHAIAVEENGFHDLLKQSGDNSNFPG